MYILVFICAIQLTVSAALFDIPNALPQVMASPWIRQHTQVPQTPLYTHALLLDAGEAWADVQEEMTRSLATMRVDYDQVSTKFRYFPTDGVERTSANHARTRIVTCWYRGCCEYQHLHKLIRISMGIYRINRRRCNSSAINLGRSADFVPQMRTNR